MLNGVREQLTREHSHKKINEGNSHEILVMVCVGGEMVLIVAEALRALNALIPLTISQSVSQLLQTERFALLCFPFLSQANH